MKFLKLLTLLLIINNFAFSAEMDNKQKEEIAKIDRTVKGKEIIGKIDKQENEQFICYHARLENKHLIYCTKYLKKNLISCIISFKRGSMTDEENCESFYFYKLERLYNNQSPK